MKGELAMVPSEVVVAVFWYNTPISPAGLEIVEVEMVSPESQYGR